MTKPPLTVTKPPLTVTNRERTVTNHDDSASEKKKQKNGFVVFVFCFLSMSFNMPLNTWTTIRIKMEGTREDKKGWTGIGKGGRVNALPWEVLLRDLLLRPHAWPGCSSLGAAAVQSRTVARTAHAHRHCVSSFWWTVIGIPRVLQ